MSCILGLIFVSRMWPPLSRFLTANYWLIQEQQCWMLITSEWSPTTRHHPVTAYKLSKSEIINITVWKRLRNPLMPGRSCLTANGARANTNSVHVLTLGNQFRQIQTMWLFFMSLTSSRTRNHAIYSYEHVCKHKEDVPASRLSHVRIL